MRVLSWTLLLAGISVFTLGCTTETTTPVETDKPVVTEGEHEHAEGETHETEAAPVEGEAAPVEPAPEAPAPEAPAGEVPAEEPAVGN